MTSITEQQQAKAWNAELIFFVKQSYRMIPILSQQSGPTNMLIVYLLTGMLSRTI